MLVSSYTQLKDVLCIKLGKEILTEVLKLFQVYLLRALSLALEPLKGHSAVELARSFSSLRQAGAFTFSFRRP